MNLRDCLLLAALTALAAGPLAATTPSATKSAVAGLTPSNPAPASAMTPGESASAPKAPPASPPFAWEDSVVYIEVTGKTYNYAQPWQEAERKAQKTGVVVGDHEIITTAADLNDETLVRLRKHGGGLYSLGKVAWIDYQANLAVITTDEAGFWDGLRPAALQDPTPIEGSVRIEHWDNDELAEHQGDIERYTVDNSALSFVSVPVLRVDSTVPSAGDGDAVTLGDKLVGLASEQDGNTITAVPSSFIASILHARRDGRYTGLGYFDFTWEVVDNPLCLDYLKLPGEPRGVIIKDAGMKPGVVSVVKPRDVLLQIDGFDIDAEGNYQDPQYQRLVLENLSSRGKWAGDECKLKIWRDGHEMNVTYKLPRAEFSDELLAEHSFDQPPEYVLVGGFVFVTLNEDFLRSWGADWRARAPFRLTYFGQDKVTPERPTRVVISEVLPSELNQGYENLRDQVIDDINGVKIGRVSDIVDALKKPVDGYDVFTFAVGQSVRHAVLDPAAIDRANVDIMAEYHIPFDHVLNGTPKPDAPETTGKL
jgi:hypothetical protein